MTEPLDRLIAQLEDVDNLLSHHSKDLDRTVGKPTVDEGPLMRSGVVLAYAAWEVYVEDGLIWAAEQMANATNFSRIPSATRAFVAQSVSSDPWRLAADGWRHELVDAVTRRVRGDDANESSYGINTAGPRQISAIYDEIVGERLLNNCRWASFSNRKVKERLALLVTVRGSIVHTGRPPGALHLRGVRDWREFVERLGRKLDTELIDWSARMHSLVPESKSD